ncbi:rRNA methyltransferase 1, mitochondrial [Genypterus blacodes]|uniref:rRNA methyltransferase 1, mitochondrial n=1 Tax=Genypterus blacodes TaxID=154954 RepID=UPI003F75F204
MWARSIAYQHRLLLVWNSRLFKPLPNSSQCASYHGTCTLLCPVDSGVKPVTRKRRSVINSSGFQYKPLVSDRWQDHEPLSPSKSRKKEMSGLQRQKPQGGNHRASSELSKLSLEDFSTETERSGRKKSAKDPKAENYEIVFGISPCLLALTHGRRKTYKLFVKDGESSHRTSVLKVCEAAHQQGVLVQRVRKKDLDMMASGHVHQGVCLQASPLSFVTKDRDSTPRVPDSTTPLWLVLDGIQDPMNLGAILRSAYFLGVDRVASRLNHSCPLTPVVSKASSGAMEVIGVYGYQNLEEMVKLKVAQGWQVVGTVGAETEEHQIPVTQCSNFQMTKPTLLLMGGEGTGLSQELLSQCQTLLTIPVGRKLFPGIDSLNVSVATGILLHSMLFSRRPARS